MKALAIGGVEDHVHILLSIPSTLSVAKAVQLLKGNSSKWIHDTFKEHWDFEWQEGYGAFSIAVSGVDDTIKYIAGQREHHRTIGFREELEIFLKKHGMEFMNRDLDWLMSVTRVMVILSVVPGGTRLCFLPPTDQSVGYCLSPFGLYSLHDCLPD